jgi:hypothetical protein
VPRDFGKHFFRRQARKAPASAQITAPSGRMLVNGHRSTMSRGNVDLLPPQLAARCCCAEFGSRFQTGLTGTCTWPRLCRRILALQSYGELPASLIFYTMSAEVVHSRVVAVLKTA